MRINALPKTPEFLLHTGDLTHLTGKCCNFAVIR
jgi:hypothetical protein